MSATEDRQQDTTDLAKGTGVNLLGNFGRISAAVAFIFASRVFGMEAVGIYVLAWSVIDLVSKLAIFGLDISVVKFITRSRLVEAPGEVYKILGDALSISLGTSITFAVLVYFLSPWVAGEVFDKSYLIWPLRSLAFAIPLTTCTFVLLGTTKALKIMSFDVLVKTIVEPLTFLAGVGISALVMEDGQGMVYAQLLALLGGAITSVVLFSRHYSVRRCVSEMSLAAFRSELARIAFPVSLYNLLSILAARLDVFMLGYFLPIDRVGIYGMAREVAFVVKKNRQASEPIFAPIVSEHIQKGETARVADSMSTVTRWTLAISLPYVGILYFAGDYILGLYGPEVVLGTNAAVLLAIAHLVNGVFIFAELMLLMAGRPYLNLINMILTVLISGAACITLIPSMDLMGPPVAALISFGLVHVVRLIQVKKVIGVHPFRWSLCKSLIAFSGAMAVVLLIESYVTGSIPFGGVLSGAMFLLVYGGLIWGLKLEPEELRLIGKIGSRIKRILHLA
jgi:O-antigen/teichoic acid export membrane protein